jgi:exodeoxyribonuclease VII small subunit
MAEQAAEEAGFEQAMTQLEQIVQRIESGEIGLEQMLEQYEHGNRLVQRCQKVLTAAEQRIEQLTVGADGTLRGGEDAGDEAEDADDADTDGGGVEIPF